MKKRTIYLTLGWIFAVYGLMHNAALAQTESSHEVIAPSVRIHAGEDEVNTAPALAPARNATEVLERLLTLIDSLHQSQDLAPARVSKFTGLSMPRIDRSPGYYIHADGEYLTNIWSYGYVWKLNDTTKLPGLRFGFELALGHSDPKIPMTDICQFDVAQFHDALLRLGFRHVSSTRRESPARQYQRDMVLVEIGMVGESGESLEKISHNCINRVSIDFLEKYIDLGALQ